MKAVESKTTSLAKNTKANQPFFSKEAEGGFFGKSGNEQSDFFKPSSAYTVNGGGVLQTKLTIGQPNDKYEQEADAMADKVAQRLALREPIHNKETEVQAKPLTNTITPLVQAKCAACEKEEKLQKKEEEDLVQELPLDLQRKPIFESDAEPPDDESNIQRKCAECEKEEKLQTKSGLPTASVNIESSLNSSKGRGSPIPAETRQQMESSFGADFSGVRLHTDSSAVQMSKDLNAQAFTHGNDIYFNSGKFDVNSTGGKHLLAHELTHTVQQTAKGGLQKVQRFPSLSDIINVEERIEQFRATLNELLPAFQPFPDGLVAFKDRIQSLLSARIEALQASAGSLPSVTTASSSGAIPSGSFATSSTVNSVPGGTSGGVRIPAGGCGLCYGGEGGIGPRDAGNVAHMLIQRMFLTSYPGGAVEVPISSASGRGVLDLAVYIPSQQRLEIGEIKPANGTGIAAGVSQMILYETILSELLPNVLVMPLTRIIPSPIPFPTLSPNCPTQSMSVLPPVAGIYAYLCTPSYAQLLAEGCNCRETRRRVRERVNEPERVRVRLTNSQLAVLILLLLALIGALILIFAPVPEPIHKAVGLATAGASLAALVLFFNTNNINSPDDIA